MSDLDVITVAEAASTVGIADTTEDTKLSLYVTAISSRLDVAVGPIVQREVVETVSGSCVRLSSRPVVSVDSVTDNGDELVAGTDYEVRGNFLVRLDGRCFDDAEVEYTAGRFADTASVDARYKVAAQIMLRNIWRIEQTSTVAFGEYEVPTQSFPTFTVPKAVKDLLADQWQVRTGQA